MEEHNLKEKKFNKNFYILFNGLGADILFYVAVNILFLTTIKGLSASNITLLSTISSLVCIFLFFPIRFLINKIKRQYSVIIKGFFILVSIILFTFGKSLWVFIIADLVYEIGFIFGQVSYIIFKNNLDVIGEGDKYLKYKGYSNLIYAIVTCIIALVSGYLFSINSYLPMYLAIFTTAIQFIMSFFYKELPSSDNITETKTIKKFSFKLIFSSFMILIFFGLMFVLKNIHIVQKYSRLSLQYKMQNFNLDLSKISIILGYIIIGSRIIRILGSYFLPKLYYSFKNKKIYILFLPVLLLISCIFIITGILINNLLLGLVFISLGFYITLFIRDTTEVVFDKIIFDNTRKKDNVLVIKSFFTNIGNLILNSLTLIFLNYLQMYFIYIMFAFFAAIGIIVMSILTKKANI